MEKCAYQILKIRACKNQQGCLLLSNDSPNLPDNLEIRREELIIFIAAANNFTLEGYISVFGPGGLYENVCLMSQIIFATAQAEIERRKGRN
jgi:hypothetical protein